MIREIQAIDLHCHYNHGSPYDAREHALVQMKLDYLRKMYDATNIVCGVFSPMACFYGPHTILEENEHARQMSKELPWFWQWAVLDPRREESFAQVAQMLEDDKCLGIKIHPYSHKYDTAEYADRIFAFANEHKTVVLTHPDDPKLIGRVVPFADKHPDMKLIIAHLGSVEHVEAIRRAKHQNIYTDTSGQLSRLNRIVEYAVEQVGSEKIFFGTDTYACGFQRGRIAYALMEEKDKENILRNNALREFPKLKKAIG